MYVDQIMTCDVVKVTEDSKVAHIAGYMQARRIRHLPVVDAQDALVGIISHRDVQKASPSGITTLSAGEANYLLAKLTARDIMHRRIVTCHSQTLVEDAACLMREHTIGCLPVVDEGRLVGIVTSVDLLDFFLDITGCREENATRLTLRLEDKQGNLSRLLRCLDESGGHLVSVITPQQQTDDEAGIRNVIVRFRAQDPAVVSHKLREHGYAIVSEQLPADQTRCAANS